MFRYLARNGVYVVTSAGNDAEEQIKITDVPAIWGDPSNSDFVLGLTVVGAIDHRNGQRAGFSQYEEARQLPHVYAPGVKVSCARSNTVDVYVPQDGTSLGKVFSLVAQACWF